jgi:N utilization substance protein B
LVLGASRDQTPLWQAIEPLLDRGGDEIDPVERSILLLGAFELKTHIEIPFKVVISEAVDIAKIFGATDSYKYINSILDRLALAFRAVETSALGR